MDPLSISASITALLQLTSTVIQYLNGVKGAPEDRRTILSELASVNGILFILQDEADQAKQGDQWSSTLRSLNVSDGPLDQFRRALERLASKLASPATGLKKLGKSIVWPFQKEEIKEILGSIERQKRLLNLARQNDHVKLSKAIKNDLDLMRDEVEVVAKGVSKIEMSQISPSSQDVNPKPFDLDPKSLVWPLAEHLRIIDWLAAPDPSTNYNRALKDRNPKTGLWFIEGSTYIDWKTRPGSFLWLHGIPGCGKTILSSTILQNVLAECQAKTNSAVLYFYFDFNDAEKERHEKMIRSLISQLSRCSVGSALQDLHSSCLHGGRQPTLELLLETLRRMMEPFGDIYVVIDALDECTEREQLLTDLEEMASWEDVSLHMLATSRRETDIEESLSLLSDERNRISIQSALVNADIRTYTHDRLQNDRKLRRWLKHPEVQLEIEDTLVKKAAGMFRWAACQLDSLGDCFSLSHLRQALASLPRTLDETYARILCNIDRAYSDYNMQILKLLQWLTFSARPLRLEELVETFAIDTNKTPRFDPERRLPEPRDILTLCSSLITLSGHDDDDSDGESDSELTAEYVYQCEEYVYQSDDVYVTLAHFSVKEYLISDRIQRGTALHYSIQELESHDVLARDCIAYLLHFDVPGSLRSETIETYPLLQYAAECWTEHAKNAEKGPTRDSTLLAMELFMTEREGFLNWIRIHDLDRLKNHDLSLKFNELASPLYYAARAGLSEPVKFLIEAGKGVNVQGGKYGNALQAASKEGYAHILHLLLDNGADINAESGYFNNALQAASYSSRTDIVQLLLDKGADINTQGGELGSALQAASYSGYIDTVQLLLDNGADINAESGYFNNALQAASYSRGTDIVQLLLDSGADINAQGGHYGNALQAASRSGHIDTVQLLLDNGADSNAQGGQFGNALLAALNGESHGVALLLLQNGAHGGNHGESLVAACGSRNQGGLEDVVKLLLEQGADVNAPDKDSGRIALLLASERGHEHVVKLLLEKGADVNALDKDSGRAALLAASERGYENVVKMLLENGADVNRVAETSTLETALQAASLEGYETIVKMLLENGADVNRVAKESSFGTALQAASWQGHESIMKILLENGADINARAGYHQTALVSACEFGNEKMVQLLLDKGADTNAQGGEKDSALKVAAEKGYENIVKMLLDKGANVEGKAVQAAARWGHENIVKMLLDKGANVEGMAVQVAAYGEREKIVKMLVAKGAVIQEYEAQRGNT